MATAQSTTPEDSDDLRTISVRLALSTRWNGDQGERTLALRRQLTEAKLSKYISRVVATAPPLTPEQVHRLSTLLHPAD